MALADLLEASPCFTKGRLYNETASPRLQRMSSKATKRLLGRVEFRSMPLSGSTSSECSLFGTRAEEVRVLELGYGLKWSRGGVCRALERPGSLAAPTYQQLKSGLRQSPVVCMDNT